MYTNAASRAAAMFASASASRRFSTERRRTFAPNVSNQAVA
jgi:hypothetical protein